MANPEPLDRDLKGIRRANRDEEQHVHWETIEGGRGRNARDPQIGADLTRSPFDESLARDADGNLREDRVDVLHGYGETNAERNYPAAYNRDELINTDLNPAMVYPRRTTLVFKVVAIVLGLVGFSLLIAAMYWNWLAPVSRSPEKKNSSLHAPANSTLALRQLASFVHRANERR